MRYPLEKRLKLTVINAAQNLKYWCHWRVISRSNRWQWLKCRMAGDAINNFGIHHLAVLRIADARADQNCRAIAAADLRHDCHVHSIGRDIFGGLFIGKIWIKLLIGCSKIDR